MTTWLDTVETFKRVTDKLGKPIDDGIFDTVVALNLLGIVTTASCEGHIGWGVPHPWIDIEPELQQKYLLHQYLAQFYAARSGKFDSILIFHGYRLRSVGAAFYSLLPDDEQARKLAEYRAEMACFTDFMKEEVCKQ